MPSTTPRRRPGISPSISRCWATVPSTMTAGARLSVARPVVHRSGQAGGEPIPRPDSNRARCESLGALSRERGLCREPQRGRGKPGQADRDGGPVVRRGRQIQRAARGWSLMERAQEERPQIAVDRKSYTFYPNTQPISGGLPQHAEPAAQHHRPCGDPQGRGRGRAAFGGGRRWRICLLREGWEAVLHP